MARLHLARALIGLVLLVNLQCALALLLQPARFASGFELSGAPGEAAVRGFGLLFLMWNVPYALAAWHPARHRLSLYESLAMQSVGLVGEGLIWLTLPPAHAVLRATIERFSAFDFLGWLLLAAAVWLTRRRSG